MRQLILVRHAKALDREKAKTRHITEAQRPLTLKGQSQFFQHLKKNVKILKKADLYIASSFLRSQQTLTIILDQIKMEKPRKKILTKITSEDDPGFLYNWLQNRRESKIVIVSHEPLISHFLNMYLDVPWKPRKIKKGTIIVLKRTRKKLKLQKIIQNNR